MNIGAPALTEETPLTGWGSPLVPPLPQNQLLPGPGGSFQWEKPVQPGAEAHALVFPHPGAGRTRSAARRQLRALPSPGAGRSPLWIWGPASPDRPFRCPRLAQSSRFVRKNKNCVCVGVGVRDARTRSRSSGGDERRASKPSPLPSAAAQTCGGLLPPIGAPPSRPHQAANSPSAPLPAAAGATLRPIATASERHRSLLREGMVTPKRKGSRSPHAAPAPRLPGHQGSMGSPGVRPARGRSGSAAAPRRVSLAPVSAAAAVPRVGRVSDAF